MARRWKRPTLAALAMGLALALGLTSGTTFAQAATTPAELVGSWDLVTLQAAGQPAEDTTGAGLTLVFGADGRVTGSGGCNGFGGTVSTDDRGRLQITEFVATLRACVDTAINAREQRYFAALQEARGYTLDGAKTLRLGFDQPGRQLVFRRTGSGAPGLPSTGAGGMAGTMPGAGPALPGGLLAGASVGWWVARKRRGSALGQKVAR